MAVNYNEFCYTSSNKEGKSLISGLKANADFTKFLYIARIDGKQVRKVINLSKLQLNKKDSIKRANDEAEKFFRKKEEEIQNNTSFTFDTKFKPLAEAYIKNKCTINTKWTKEKEKMLEHYIYPHIGNMKASAVKEMNIDKIRVSMETSGVWRQNKDGCSPRTIRKVLLQVLKPILEYGYRNGALKRIPEINVPKKPKKKTVKNGAEKLTILYSTIHSLYRNEPFYRGLFLFAFFGRRWNEIRTLEWSDIDFEKNEYTVRAENSKIDEDKTFVLPKDVTEALNHFQEEKGLVFRSPKTGRELSTPKKQMEKLREASGIEELTLHYFRHIMATALGESGMVNTVLSASLGHNNSATVDNYYRTANHLRGSEEATQAIEHIVEVEK
jgi:integrase